MITEKSELPRNSRSPILTGFFLFELEVRGLFFCDLKRARKSIFSIAFKFTDIISFFGALALKLKQHDFGTDNCEEKEEECESIKVLLNEIPETEIAFYVYVNLTFLMYTST